MHKTNYDFIKAFILNFAGFFFGSFIYSALIQYSDFGIILIADLVSDVGPWVFTLLVVSVLFTLSTSKGQATNLGTVNHKLIIDDGFQTINISRATKCTL